MQAVEQARQFSKNLANLEKKHIRPPLISHPGQVCDRENELNVSMSGPRFGLTLAYAFLGAGLPPLVGQNPSTASKIYADSSKSVFLLIVKSEAGDVIAQGSGFMVRGGRIVTNEHVARAGRVFIDLGSVKLPTKVERVDVVNDLALLSTNGDLAARPLGISDAIPVPGSPIYTIGNPAGLERTISTGVVSGIRKIENRQLIQISSPISPGSSGGPVFNIAGLVIGVAVGGLEGQNLNFAVPGLSVSKLIRGEVQADKDVPSLIGRVDSLSGRLSQCEYSADPGSDWQKLYRQIEGLLQDALERAGVNLDLLLAVAAKAGWEHVEIAISAAQRAIRIRPSPEADLILGKGLYFKAMFATNKNEQPALWELAEKAVRSAIKLSKQPTSEMYYELANVLEDRGSPAEAETAFRTGRWMSKTAGDADMEANNTLGLVRTAYALGKPAEGAAWFKLLIASDRANASDWQGNGRRLRGLHQDEDAARSYRQAALLGGTWEDWCEAASSYAVVPGAGESVLECARRCLSEGAGKKDSEGRLANAHVNIAYVLIARGVYQEALSHGREAAALDSSSPFAFNSQAEALSGMRRFQEAINASNQAIRLSDGKYSFMHFDLGSEYFDTENWEFAKQSFERAAQMDPTDTAAPYNVALCLARLGYNGDAARWFEEVLRRNPNHPQKQEILNRIQALRR